MNALKGSRATGWIAGQINQLGRTLVTDSIGRSSNFHPDQPRASSHINFDYCVKALQTGLLAGSKRPTPGKTINSYLTVSLENSFVVNPVLTAPRLSQRKDISPGMSGCYQESKSVLINCLL